MSENSDILTSFTAIVASVIAVILYLIDYFSVGVHRYTGGVVARLPDPVVTINDIIITNVAKSKYNPKARDPPSIHIGQRKLLLNEIQFLTEMCAGSEQVLVVYAGAAPGNKTGYLSKLFPNVVFLLVDPNPFDIFVVDEKPVFINNVAEMGNEFRNRIYVLNSYYTNEISRDLAAMVTIPIYFISDIRTDTTDIHILWNHAQQYNWIQLLKPRAAMLKFRHIFYMQPPDELKKLAGGPPFAQDFLDAAADGIDFIADACEKKLTYFDGEIRIQPWAPLKSAETRLIVTDIASKRTYDDNASPRYEDTMFYYNTVLRGQPHYNDNADLKVGFDHCNDCALENLIWKNYNAVCGKKRRVIDYVNDISKLTHRPLLKNDHGKV